MHRVLGLRNQDQVLQEGRSQPAALDGEGRGRGVGNLEDAACLSPSDVVVRRDGDRPAAPTYKGLGSHPDAGSRIEFRAPASREGIMDKPTQLCVGDGTNECNNENKGTLPDRSRRHVG